MNNKAFTLVELLAVIVMVALISGVAVVAYNNITSSVKTKVYTTYEIGMKTAIQEAVIDEPSLLGVDVPLSYLVGEDKGGLSVDLPKVPYLDLFNNPDNSNDFCLSGSYARASLEGNKTIIKVCFKCTNYQSSTC